MGKFRPGGTATGRASYCKRGSRKLSDAKRDFGVSPAWAAGLAIGAVSVALFLGGRSRPSSNQPLTKRWYDRLQKPGFTPPKPVFALAWPALQAAQAYSGYGLLRAANSPERTTALVFWGANQVGVAGWSEVFFGQKAPGWATVGSAALSGSAIGHVMASRLVDQRAAIAGVPLVAWVGFATLLTEEIWRRNDTADSKESAQPSLPVAAPETAAT